MLRRILTVALPLALLPLSALAAACDGGGADDEATPTVSPAATVAEMTATPTQAVATATATPPPDIQQEDLTEQPGLRDFLASAGGEVDPDRNIYVDLTGDGVDEAVVPVSSGGEGGDIAVFVFGYGADGLQLLLQAESRRISAAVEGGQLVTAEPVYGPGDPFGDPSQLLRRYYRWNGNELEIEREEQVPAR